MLRVRKISKALFFPGIHQLHVNDFLPEEEIMILK